MTKQQKLTKLIETAVENGYIPYDDPSCVTGYSEKEDKFWIQCGMGGISYHNVIETLFSHDFAKAIWGEKKWVKPCIEKNHWRKGGDIHRKGYYRKTRKDESTNWQYHLQQCVISENPLQYYWENKP